MKIIILIIVGFLGYFIWYFVIQNRPLIIMTTGSEQKVLGNIKLPIQPNLLAIQIHNNKYDNVITSIEIPRDIYTEFDLSAPKGFKHEALPLGKDNDPEMIKFVEDFNKKTIRYVGKLKLVPNQTTIIAFTAKNLIDIRGEIAFHYERKVGFGGSMSSLYVKLNPQMEIANDNI